MSAPRVAARLHGLLFALVVVVGCGRDQERRQASSSVKVVALKSAGLDNSPKAWRAALTLPVDRLITLLSDFRLTLRATLRAEATGRVSQLVSQRIVLHKGPRGGLLLDKTTHPQYGASVVWSSPWLYVRQRYSKFTRRAAPAAQARALVGRLCGLLPDYVALLGPKLAISAIGRREYLGRPVLSVNLSQTADSWRSAFSDPSRRWRQTIVVGRLSGSALIDLKTAVPLSVDLNANWRYALPKRADPQTGIPAAFDRGSLGTMKLRFSQRIDQIGGSVPVQPPQASEIMPRLYRDRLEIERQYLLGERKLPPWWRKYTGSLPVP